MRPAHASRPRAGRGVCLRTALRPRAPPQRALLPPSLLADVAALAVEPTFEPRLNPAALIGAACAAVPPVVFWARIAVNARKRVNKEEADERARLERLDRLSGK